MKIATYSEIFTLSDGTEICGDYSWRPINVSYTCDESGEYEKGGMYNIVKVTEITYHTHVRCLPLEKTEKEGNTDGFSCRHLTSCEECFKIKYKKEE